MSNNLHPHYAIPTDPGLETVMRFGAVKRWHMLDTVRVQTLAEHSGNVALLCFHIAVTAPQMFFGPAMAAATAGLVHDLPEVFTGDIPTPTKKCIDQPLTELERNLLPLEFRWKFMPPISILVKTCDRAEALRYIRIHGNSSLIIRHAESGVQQRFMEQLVEAIKLGWPMEVLTHTFGKAWTYAYETGDFALETTINEFKKQVDRDSSRGP